MRIRLARPSDLRHLAGIEQAGVAPFEDLFGDDLHPVLRTPPPSGAQREDADGFLLVAADAPTGGTPIGFVHVLELDGHAHLEQVSVRPDRFRRGVGSALVRAAGEEARWAGHRRISLCTYRDVPWNGPFYARSGFTEVPEAEWLPFQRRLREHEVAVGLDANGPRMVMAAPLDRAASTPGGRA